MQSWRNRRDKDRALEPVVHSDCRDFEMRVHCHGLPPGSMVHKSYNIYKQ